MGKARILKGVCTPEYIYTNKPRYDRDLKNTDVVVNHAVHNILKELGDKITKEQAEILFNSYANLSSDIDLMNGPADVMIQTEGNHEMDTNWAQGTLTVLGIDGDLVDFIILSGWLQPEFQTEKAEVFTEKIDMSVTE
jgi:hypothetical protein